MYVDRDRFISLIKDLPNDIKFRVNEFEYYGEDNKGYYISCVTDVYKDNLANKNKK